MPPMWRRVRRRGASGRAPRSCRRPARAGERVEEAEEEPSHRWRFAEVENHHDERAGNSRRRSTAPTTRFADIVERPCGGRRRRGGRTATSQSLPSTATQPSHAPAERPRGGCRHTPTENPRARAEDYVARANAMYREMEWAHVGREELGGTGPLPLRPRPFGTAPFISEEAVMSYPTPRYLGKNGEISAAFRPASTEPELSSAGQRIYYLATHASTRGDFGLYRVDMAPGRRVRAPTSTGRSRSPSSS
jgi:hypothetical protein